MTIEDVAQLASYYPVQLLAYFSIPPVLSWILGIFQRNRVVVGIKKYVYSLLIFLVTIPGIVSLSLTAYLIFFSRQNLLKLNILIYFLPIISMIVTLAFIGRKADFDSIPGFDRLSGLMALIAVTFFIILLIYKTRIFVVFYGSLEYLLIIGVILFVLLQRAAAKLFK
ncbi:MAG: hypothetical protein HQK77_12260 [Desulfobacterales bacterium]|nr:hypothetical protein [Desulfobacterales bacterium]